MDSFIEILSSMITSEFLFTVIRVTTPILFAAIAAIVSNKAGVTNIALEGIMLCAALFGVIASGFTQNLFIGALGAIFGGLIITWLLAYFALKLDTDIVLSGIALNMLAVGGTVFILFIISGDRGVSTGIQSLVFPKVDIPFIKDIPFIGAVISGHNILTYLAFSLVGFVGVFLYKTPLGLRMRSVGENEHAAESVGINVLKIKFIALTLSGIIASLGGAYMSMGYLSNFSRNMISGRGYIAMAAEAMGQSKPGGTLISSLIFGAAESLSYKLQSLAIPAEIVRMVPYLATIIGLIIYSQANKIRQNKKKKNMEEKNVETITDNH